MPRTGLIKDIDLFDNFKGTILFFLWIGNLMEQIEK